MTNSERFAALRKRVFAMIEKELDEDSYHKSYEGAIDVTLSYPNYFEESDTPGADITLHCYILVNGRHITFSGNSMAEALDRFEEWVRDREEWYAAN